MGHELRNIEHFAMPTRHIALLERFVRDILGGVPYYYAGYDEVDREMGRKPHIFIRVGDVLFQCTEEGGSMHPAADDPCPAPHWAFRIKPGALNEFLTYLQQCRIPVAGPLAQPQFGGRSIYFKTPEGHKLEVFEPGTQILHDPAMDDEAAIDWLALNNDWRPKTEAAPLTNLNPAIGVRDDDASNVFGLGGLHHFALPAADGARLRRFFIDLLDAKPHGEHDQGGQAPVSFGSTCLQCLEGTATPLYPETGNNNISPHWSFGTTTEGVDYYKTRLEEHGIPVAGPYRHRGVDLVSIYFKTPEGHKLEIGTWDGYPEERSGLMGAPGVGFIPWPRMDHNWAPAKEMA